MFYLTISKKLFNSQYIAALEDEALSRISEQNETSLIVALYNIYEKVEIKSKKLETFFARISKNEKSELENF